MDFKQELISVLKRVVSGEVILEVPPNPAWGDFALPCFRVGMKPHELQQALKLPGFVERTEIKGMYLNFFLKKKFVAEQVLREVIKLKGKYGARASGKGKKVLLEHTSLNPNSSPHVGRARNAMMGDALARLLRFEGYKTEVHYFVNDVGKQIAMLVVACAGKKPTFNALLEKYVQFNERLKSDPAVEQKVFALLAKFEAGEKRTISQFRRIVKVCLDGQMQLFREFGIGFDKFDFESAYLLKKVTARMVVELEKTGKVFMDEEKRKVVNLEGFGLPMENPILPLTRADGTSLYILRDLVYTREKMAKKVKRNIIVLGEDQKLYFQQLKAILSLLGEKAPEVVHYAYVLVSEGKKMSTRQGDVVLLEEFMREAREKALKEIEARKLAKGDKMKLAKTIGYGAIKFAFLRVSADKNITFEWDRALAFEGESGPYVQYAHARACAILRRAKGGRKVDGALLATREERAVVQKLMAFPDVVAEVARTLQPHLLATFALELARVFNEFYHACPVLQAPPQTKEARLALVRAFVIVVENALSVLGIDAPTSM